MINEASITNTMTNMNPANAVLAEPAALGDGPVPGNVTKAVPVTLLGSGGPVPGNVPKPAHVTLVGSGDPVPGNVPKDMLVNFVFGGDVPMPAVANKTNVINTSGPVSDDDPIAADDPIDDTVDAAW